MVFRCSQCGEECPDLYALTEHVRAHPARPSLTQFQLHVDCGSRVTAKIPANRQASFDLNVVKKEADDIYPQDIKESVYGGHQNDDKRQYSSRSAEQMNNESYAKSFDNDSGNDVKVVSSDGESVEEISDDEAGLQKEELDHVDLSFTKKATQTGNATNNYTCSLCNNCFETYGSFKLHVSNSKLRRKQCWVCSKWFCLTKDLIRHFEDHPGAKPIRCKGCRMIGSSIQELKDHEEKTGHGTLTPKIQSSLQKLNHKLKCWVCLQLFQTEKLLVSHFNLHPERKPFRCDQCEEMFWASYELKNHKKSHQEDYSSDTESIQFRLADEQNSTESVEVTRNNDEAKTASTTPKSKMYQCNICQEKFSSEYRLKCHQIYSLKGLKECDQCPMKFCTLGSLKEHTKEVHELNTAITDLKCNICQLTFTNNAGFWNHRNKSAGIRECPHCGMKFCSFKSFQEHFQTAHPDQELHSMDPAKVTSSQTLDTSSPECKSNDNNLSSASLPKCDSITTDLKCEICLSTFSNGIGLWNHKNKSSGIRECQHCGKKFCSFKSLQVHFQTVHPDQELPTHSASPTVPAKVAGSGTLVKCEICQLTFNSQGFGSHKKKSSGIKECQHCGKKFCSFKSLQEHFQTAHPDQEPQAHSTDPAKVKSSQILGTSWEGHKSYDGKNSITTSLSEHDDITTDLKCEICLLTFSNVAGFLNHKNKSSGIRECQHCGKKFCSFKSLQEHFKTTHPDQELQTHSASPTVPAKVIGSGILATPPADCSQSFKENISTSACLSELDDTVKDLKCDVKDLKCDICLISFASSKGLWNHKNKSYGIRECQHCGKKFCSFKSLQEHFKTIHPDQELQTHSASPTVPAKVIGSGILATPQADCSQSFKENVSTSSCLSELDDTVKDLKCDVKDLKCDICLISFASSKGLWNHKTKSSGVRECQHCGKKFCSDKTFQKHFQTAHPDLTVPVTGSRSLASPQAECSKSSKESNSNSACLLECESCQVVFFSRLSFEKHRSVPLQCYFCKTWVCSKKGMGSHFAKDHVGEKAHWCDVCGLAFRSVNGLLYHQQKAKRSSCRQGKDTISRDPKIPRFKFQNFKQVKSGNHSKFKRRLILHKTKGYGQGRLRGMAKMIKAKLNKQMNNVKETTGDLTETEPTNILKCSRCDAKFKGNHALKKHMKLNTTKFWFCRICGAKFCTRLQLEVHFKSHPNEQLYRCSCNNLSCSKEIFAKHLLNCKRASKSLLIKFGVKDLSYKGSEINENEHSLSAVPDSNNAEEQTEKQLGDLSEDLHKNSPVLVSGSCLPSGTSFKEITGPLMDSVSQIEGGSCSEKYTVDPGKDSLVVAETSSDSNSKRPTSEAGQNEDPSTESTKDYCLDSECETVTSVPENTKDDTIYLQSFRSELRNNTFEEANSKTDAVEAEVVQLNNEQTTGVKKELKSVSHQCENVNMELASQEIPQSPVEGQERDEQTDLDTCISTEHICGKSLRKEPSSQTIPESPIEGQEKDKLFGLDTCTSSLQSNGFRKEDVHIQQQEITENAEPPADERMALDDIQSVKNRPIENQLLLPLENQTASNCIDENFSDTESLGFDICVDSESEDSPALKREKNPEKFDSFNQMSVMKDLNPDIPDDGGNLYHVDNVDNETISNKESALPFKETHSGSKDMTIATEEESQDSAKFNLNKEIYEGNTILPTQNVEVNESKPCEQSSSGINVQGLPCEIKSSTSDITFETADNVLHPRSGEAKLGGLPDFNEKDSFIPSDPKTSLETEPLTECNWCGRSFALNSLLNKHLKQRMGKHRCGICFKKLCDVKTYTEHFEQNHPGEAPFTCEYCGMFFGRYLQLKTHAQKVHKKAVKTFNSGKNLGDQQGSQKKSLNKLDCPVCNQKFCGVQPFLDHCKMKHPGKIPCQCQICGEEFDSCSSLAYHSEVCKGLREAETKEIRMVKEITGKIPHKSSVNLETNKPEIDQLGGDILKNSDYCANAALNERTSITNKILSYSTDDCRPGTKYQYKHEDGRFTDSKSAKRSLDSLDHMMDRFKFLKLDDELNTGVHPTNLPQVKLEYSDGHDQICVPISGGQVEGVLPYRCETCKSQFSSAPIYTQHLLQGKCAAEERKTSIDHVEGKIMSSPVALQYGKSFGKTIRGPKASRSRSSLCVEVACWLCGVKCASQALLKDHFRRHPRKKPFQCESCKATFVNVSNLQRHRVNACKPKPESEVESLSGKEDSQFHGETLHHYVLNIGTLFKCSVCGRTNNKSENILHHISICHPNLLMEKKNESPGPLQCKVCGKTVTSQQRLQFHMALHKNVPRAAPKSRKHFNIRKYKVGSVPQMQYSSRIYSKKSESPADNSEKGYSSESRNLTCRQCDKEFVNLHKLKVHLIFHDAKCWVCKKTYSNFVALQLHFQQHPNKKPFCCTVCKETFKRKDHLLVHTDKFHPDFMKKYLPNLSQGVKLDEKSENSKPNDTLGKPGKETKCWVCSKILPSYAALRNHFKFHPTKKPFKCMECNRTYVSNQRLVEHSAVH